MNKLFELTDVGKFSPIPYSSKTAYKNWQSWWLRARYEAISLGEGNCPYCKGEMTVECDRCYGTGCPDCDGLGWDSCSRCDSDGKVTLYKVGELRGTPESIFNQLVYGSIYKPEVTITLHFRSNNE